MLILSRKTDESIMINGNIEVKVIVAEDGKVRLGIDAPQDVIIHRKEVFTKILEENLEAAKSKNQAIKIDGRKFKKVKVTQNNIIK